ncbi:MAG: hypothetical protein M1825_002438 [Sarcosagium campestre]|nr:MAG: hypothetical protein M1825_002438 [Sarcosagium campestre]
MSTTAFTEFISFLPPPGASITGYTRQDSNSDANKNIPPVFVEAMSVREEVFVDEQKVPAENELDSDDPRSFHWVTYASVSSTSKEPGRKGSETTRSPVGTIRLVPPPHPAHPIQGSEQKANDPKNGSGAIRHHGKESYVKLGRLAILKPYRGIGLSKLLVNTALEWAGHNPDSIIPLRSAARIEAARIDGTIEGPWRGLVLIHAQKGVENVWRKMGFVTDEKMGTWIEEGIPHIGMWKRVPVDNKK